MPDPHGDAVRLFTASRQQYLQFATRLEQLVVDLLTQRGIDTIQVESRVKSVESFEEKAARKGYTDPLKQTTDLVGLRIIGYYLEDIETIGQAITREFHVHQENTVKRASPLDDDQFGYRSDHYIVSIGDTRKNLTEWATYTELQAEIQVRTALQHAWAAVDHKLSYKKVRDIPATLQRRLVRLSALFELADEEFSTIKGHRDALFSEYGEEVASGDLSASVDDLSITAYVKSIEPQLADADISSWYKPAPDPHDRPMSRNALLEVLQVLEVTTVGELDEIIGNDWRKTNTDLQALARKFAESGTPPATTPYSLILVLSVMRRHSQYKRKPDLNVEAPIWVAITDVAQEQGYI